MADADDKKLQGKWDRVNTRLTRSTQPPAEPQAAEAELIPGQTELTAAPSSLEVPLPDINAKEGFLTRYQMKSIDRRTAVKEFQERCDAQLDALRFQLRRAVTVSNARADLVAEEYLKGLDAEHLEILAGLGLRNTKTRAEGLKAVNDMIVDQMKDVQGKDWPQALIDQTIDDLLELRRKASEELMRELGN